MRLVFAAKKSFGLWELLGPQRRRERGRGRGGLPPGLRRRLARRGPADPQRLLQGRRPRAAGRTQAQGLRPAPPAAGAHRARMERGRRSGDAAGRAADRRRRSGSPTFRSRSAISEPSPERAAELVRRFDPPPDPATIAGTVAPPPLLSERRSPVPIGHLSYSALALYERCGYRFYVERVLGAREGMAATPGETVEDARDERDSDELAEPEVPRDLALGIGNAVHAALEWSAGNRWDEPSDELLERLLSREQLTGDAEASRRATALIGGWLGSPLRAELGGAAIAGRGAVRARPRADRHSRPDRSACRERRRVPTVVDYKTDRLTGREPAELADRYRAQREIYALAAGPEGARVAHVFLERPVEPVIERSPPATSAPVRERLTGLIEAHARRRLRSHRRALRGALLRLPGRRAAVPAPKWKPAGVSGLAVFGYGSLVNAASLSETRRAPGRDRSAAPPARLATHLGPRPRQRGLGEDLRARRRLAPPLLPRPQHRARRRRAGPQRRPDRAQRGRARPPRPARDPLRPRRRHSARSTAEWRLRSRRRLPRQAGPPLRDAAGRVGR